MGVSFEGLVSVDCNQVEIVTFRNLIFENTVLRSPDNDSEFVILSWEWGNVDSWLRGSSFGVNDIQPALQNSLRG